MFRRLIITGNSAAGLFLRLTLGIVMLAHGLQQTVGWFGGNGLSGTIKYYTGFYHFPWIVALGGILSVSVGAILLIIGLWGRIMALLNGVFLSTAMLTVHVHNGFFMNWSGNKPGEGFEFHILGIGIALALVIYGSGWLSVDRLLTKKLHPKHSSALKSR